MFGDLGAASIVVPVAALAIGDGPAGAAIPLGAAAVAYVLLVRECGTALVPRATSTGRRIDRYPAELT